MDLKSVEGWGKGEGEGRGGGGGGKWEGSVLNVVVQFGESRSLSNV